MCTIFSHAELAIAAEEIFREPPKRTDHRIKRTLEANEEVIGMSMGANVQMLYCPLNLFIFVSPSSYHGPSRAFESLEI